MLTHSTNTLLLTHKWDKEIVHKDKEWKCQPRENAATEWLKLYWNFAEQGKSELFTAENVQILKII